MKDTKYHVYLNIEERIISTVCFIPLWILRQQNRMLIMMF